MRYFNKIRDILTSCFKSGDGKSQRNEQNKNQEDNREPGCWDLGLIKEKEEIEAKIKACFLYEIDAKINRIPKGWRYAKVSFICDLGAIDSTVIYDSKIMPTRKNIKDLDPAVDLSTLDMAAKSSMSKENHEYYDHQDLKASAFFLYTEASYDEFLSILRYYNSLIEYVYHKRYQQMLLTLTPDGEGQFELKIEGDFDYYNRWGGIASPFFYDDDPFIYNETPHVFDDNDDAYFENKALSAHDEAAIEMSSDEVLSQILSAFYSALQEHPDGWSYAKVRYYNDDDEASYSGRVIYPDHWLPIAPSEMEDYGLIDNLITLKKVQQQENEGEKAYKVILLTITKGANDEIKFAYQFEYDHIDRWSYPPADVPLKDPYRDQYPDEDE